MYAEMYREMGLAKIGTQLSCLRDQEFIESYQPHDCHDSDEDLDGRPGHCDFRYVRVTSKSCDDLQAMQRLLTKADLDFAVRHTNYR
jgi:hypothetical protein